LELKNDFTSNAVNFVIVNMHEKFLNLNAHQTQQLTELSGSAIVEVLITLTRKISLTLLKIGN